MAYYYLNGKIVPEQKALIKITDIGYLRGYGVFDFLRTYNGRPFLMKEHLDRFERSAKMLKLRIPITRKEIESVIHQLIKKNKYSESAVRVVLSGGTLVNGLEFDKAKPTFAILVEEAHSLPKQIYEKGIKLVTHEHLRVQAEAKTANYITAVLLHDWRKKHGAFEILYTYQGRLLETSTSNFMAFMGNALVVPKKDILIGTTRNFVMQLAKKHFRVVEKDLHQKDIVEFSEAFITASNKAVIPVVQIDKKKIGNGRVGANTQLLMDAYQAVIENN